MAVVLKCPFVYGHAYDRGGGRGAWGYLTVHISNLMPMTWDIWVYLLKPGRVLDWAIVGSEHRLIGPGATLILKWGRTILEDEIFRIKVTGWPYPADYGTAPRELGAADVASIDYHKIIGYEDSQPIYE